MKIDNRYIVLVEDDPDDVFLVQTAFEDLRIHDKIVSFPNGHEAMLYLLEQPESPYLIISDLNMPQMNGFELLEALKTGGVFVDGKPKFVFLSTSDKSMVSMHKLEEHIPFFTKGSSFSQVKETISSIVASTGLKSSSE